MRFDNSKAKSESKDFQLPTSEAQQMPHVLQLKLGGDSDLQIQVIINLNFY